MDKKSLLKLLKKETNLSIIFLFILIDIFKIQQLWGENIYRRLYHHLQRGIYRSNVKPWITFPSEKLYENEIEYIKTISNKRKYDCIQKISPVLSKIFGGNYSKKCSLYYNDFDQEEKKRLDLIGNRLKTHFEKIIGKKLFLGESDFRCCILSYEGKDTNFSFHYDTEEKNCYRCIYLFDKKGNVSPFTYYDENGKKIDKYLNTGSGLFFKGTKTYHGVKPNNDENSKRCIIGWQYSTDLSVKNKSLCSELRGSTIISILTIFLRYSIFLCIMLYIWNKFFYIKFSDKSLSFLTIFSIFSVLFLYKYIPKNIGTGLTINIKKLICFLFFCIIIIFISPKTGILLFNYIILTELYLPSELINKTLLDVGTY